MLTLHISSKRSVPFLHPAACRYFNASGPRTARTTSSTAGGVIMRRRQGGQFGDDNAASLVAQPAQPGPATMREMRLEQHQRLVATLRQPLEHELDVRRVGVGVHLGADQTETIGKPGAAEHDETCAAGG